MDPITASGLAASAVQFADIAARTILSAVKLLRELRDAPTRARELLEDVEHSIPLVIAILEPGARLVDRLTPQQFSRLSPSILRVRLGMEDLQRALKLLVSNEERTNVNRKGKAVQRGWKAVVSLVKQGDISEKAARVQQLNLELIRELEVVGLDLQVMQRYIILDYPYSCPIICSCR